MWNTKRLYSSIILLTFYLLLLPLNISADVIYFSYDDNGNRTSRSIYLSGNKSNITNEDEDKNDLYQYDDTIGYITFRIYPNPTHGLLIVEIPNLNKEIINIIVYDVTGSVVTSINKATIINQIDLNSCKNGIYIMNVIYEKQMQSWKIMKN